MTDPVFGWSECEAKHPTTGNQCVLPSGHGDTHEAMGLQRMQIFGPHLTSN